MRSLDLLQGPNKDWVILFFVALLAYVSTPDRGTAAAS
jgi:hypothetical protein